MRLRIFGALLIAAMLVQSPATAQSNAASDQQGLIADCAADFSDSCGDRFVKLVDQLALDQRQKFLARFVVAVRQSVPAELRDNQLALVVISLAQAAQLSDVEDALRGRLVQTIRHVMTAIANPGLIEQTQLIANTIELGDTIETSAIEETASSN